MTKLKLGPLRDPKAGLLFASRQYAINLTWVGPSSSQTSRYTTPSWRTPVEPSNIKSVP